MITLILALGLFADNPDVIAAPQPTAPVCFPFCEADRGGAK